LAAVLAGCLGGVVIGHRIERFRKAIAVLDAVGLCVYGVVGAQKSLLAGLSAPAAILVGIINACGGGLARDIITREEPLAFRPGQFYALASCAGCALYVALATQTPLPIPVSALVAMTATFLLRVFAIVFNWRTSPVEPWFSDPDEPVKPPGDT
jgi:uncharacterized membrane protein YeiH